MTTNKKYARFIIDNWYVTFTTKKVFDFHGDTNKQLARAMKAFSSSFARANRRKLLRKHFLAFDVNNTQRISRAQFVETVNEVLGRKRKPRVVAVVIFDRDR